MTVSASPARCEPEPTSGSGRVWLWTRRLVQLYVGLACYGISAAMMVRARLGLDPWDVLHQGIAHRTGHAIGTVSVVVGVFVLLLWLPLPQRPGLGTVSNVLVVGLAMNQALRVLPAQHGFRRPIGNAGRRRSCCAGWPPGCTSRPASDRDRGTA